MSFKILNTKALLLLERTKKILILSRKVGSWLVTAFTSVPTSWILHWTIDYHPVCLPNNMGRQFWGPEIYHFHCFCDVNLAVYVYSNTFHKNSFCCYLQKRMKKPVKHLGIWLGYEHTSDFSLCCCWSYYCFNFFLSGKLHTLLFPGVIISCLNPASRFRWRVKFGLGWWALLSN